VRGAQCLSLESTPTATWRQPNRGTRPACGSPMPESSSRRGTRPHAGPVYRIIGRHTWVGGRGCSPSPSPSSWCSVRCWLVPRSLPQLPANAKALIMRRSGGIRTGPWPGWCSAQPGRRSGLAPARPTRPRAMMPPATLLATSPPRRASRSVRKAPARGLAARAPSAGGTRLPAWCVEETAPQAGRRPCRSWSHPAQSRPHAARLSLHADPLRLHAAQSNPGILRSSAHRIRLRPHLVRWRPHAGPVSRDVVQWSPRGVPLAPSASKRGARSRSLSWNWTRLGSSSPPAKA
jgi:hypothetical protein